MPNTSVDEYIANAEEIGRPVLETMRSLAKQLVPTAKETFSYQMPAFKDGKIFLYFAAFKTHIGIYPPLNSDSELDTRLANFRGPKGNLKFPYANDMPYELIAEVIKALHQQYCLKK